MTTGANDSGGPETRNSAGFDSPRPPLTAIEPREAIISTYRDTSLGICIILTVADLRALGINTEEATTVQYWIDPETDQLKIASQAD